MKSWRVTGLARTKAPDAEAPAQGPSRDQAASLKWVAEVEPSELFAFKESQDLFRTRLTEPLIRLIAQLTGLRLQVLWHHPLDFQGPGERPVLCPTARQRAGANDRQPKCCEFCLQRRWKPTLHPPNQGWRFIGQCGATNFCACLQVDKVCTLTLVLQAAVAPRSPSSHRVSQGRNPPERRLQPAANPSPHRLGQGRNTRFWARHAREPVSPAAFHHAGALVRLILHDLESTAQARMAGSGLENALRRLNNTQIEAALLRGELRHRLPGLPESTVQPGLGSHAQNLIDAMRDYVKGSVLTIDNRCRCG